MRLSEIFRLVWLNLSQNKFKVILTSIGIVVGSATIMLVLAIGTGGKEEVAEQFKNLNAGAVDIICEGGTSGGGGFRMGGGGDGSFEMAGGGMPSIGGGIGEMSSGGGFGGGMPSMGGDFGGRGGMASINGNMDSDTMNSIRDSFMSGDFSAFGEMFGFGSSTKSEFVTLTTDDCEELYLFVPGLTDTTISYSTAVALEGGGLDSESYYTVAGVQDNYAAISNLEIAIGDFLSEENNENKEKVCVLGASAAKEIFGSAYEAYDGELYIDGRRYTVTGVLSEMGTVASGISPDTAVFIPYETGIKYIVGNEISPTLTVIAEDVDNVETVMADVETVLAESYPSSTFTISDAGTKMEAASASNETLTLLLISMAVIVFIVGGIGIMNVLFVSVKERTNEIGILKALGCSRKDIMLEFLLEASCISLVGAILGVMIALGITPLVEKFSVRVSLSVEGAVLSLLFGVITGTVFGFYPAFKASRLIPVVALNQE